ncbi:hypothetical protein MesoLj113b_44580 [Mesorhizobium sp. 113-3-3]|nr:hypothetical protein MesoLj113b_44580 [Mesorhizobium sp. 113-3-3]
MAGARVHGLIRLAHDPEMVLEGIARVLELRGNWLRAERARSVSGDVPIRLA